MLNKKIFLYAFIASVFFGDILVFRNIWTYGFQGIYHLMLVLFFFQTVTVKDRIPKENAVRFISCFICYYCLVTIVMLNSWNYHDHPEYYKRNITFVSLMFTSTFPLIIINRNLTGLKNLNNIYLAGGAAAFFTGMFVLILRILELGDVFSALRIQLDTIPAAWHLKIQKWTTDISEKKFLIMNLKYVIYNQIGLRMVWGYIFISCFKPLGRSEFLIQKVIKLMLILFVILSGSRESCLMLFLFMFIKSKSRKRLLLVSAVLIILAVVYRNLSELYYSDLVKDIPILNRLNVLFEFPEALKNTRLELWEGTLELLKLNPAIGIGPNGFIIYSPGLLKYIVYNADNSVLGLATAFGIAGLLIVLRFVYKPVKYILNNLKVINNDGLNVMFSGAIAYLITSLLAPHFMWPYNNPDAIFWLAVSIMLLKVDLERDAGEGL